MSDQEIAITGSGERGSGSYRLSRDPDGGRLRLAVTLEAQRLESAMAYTLVYDLVPAAKAAS